MSPSFLPRAIRRGVLVVVSSLLLIASLPMATGAFPASQLFRHPHATGGAMLAPGADAPAGTKIKPLISVGDRRGSYRFEAIPDGIAYKRAGWAGARVYVNHETSKVPFPYTSAPTTANSFNDFRNSEVSELLVLRSGLVINGRKVIGSGDGYHRFCSSFLATKDGFENRPLLFTNEEGIDWVLEDDAATGWTNASSLVGVDGARQIGTVVAYDPATRHNRPLWGLGRHNHENTVAIPGYGAPFLLSGDDPFNTVAPQSQVYAYAAADANGVWNDEGNLWAFVPDDEFAAINDYFDFPTDGSVDSISGHFIMVPKQIATGKHADGSDMLAAEVPAALGGPYPAPPADGTWQRGPGITSGPGVDGPQWILEHWGDLNNVFQFVRIEDMAYDKRPGMSNVVYLVDSGRGTAGATGPGVSTNGRVWQMVLNPADPTVVESLSILIEGDDNPVKTLGEIHQPDNIESTVNGLLITEDPGSGQQFAPADQGLPNATTARLMHYRFSDGAITAVLKVDQSADEGPTDEDAATAPGNWGAWESSGIIDVSSVFGPNKFLITVQAHSLYVDIDTTSAPDNLDPPGPDWTWKREGGQLLLVTLPGV